LKHRRHSPHRHKHAWEKLIYRKRRLTEEKHLRQVKQCDQWLDAKCREVHQVASAEAVVDELLVTAQAVVQPVLKVHLAAVRPSWQDEVSVHPGPVAVHHEVGVHERVRRLPVACKFRKKL
jgi:predicted glycoside hydrolase/deacetylase ChbG (UPF0249 family)